MVTLNGTEDANLWLFSKKLLVFYNFLWILTKKSEILTQRSWEYFTIWYSWFDFINLKEFTLDSINYLGWEWNFSIRLPRGFKILSTVSVNTKQSERLSWKRAYAMILGNNTKSVSSQLFVYSKAKLGPLWRRHYYY